MAAALDNPVSGFGVPAQSFPGIIQSQFGLVTATTASQTDLATWTARFQAGAAVSDLHTALAHSPQAEAAIGRILAQDLGRAPTKAELKTSVAFLAQGATLQDLDSQTLASITPRTVASPGKTGGIAPGIASGGGGVDPVAYWHDRFDGVLAQVFDAVYGRAPNAEDSHYWFPFTQNNTVDSFKTLVRHNLAQQAEAWNDITTDWYQVVNRGMPTDIAVFFDNELYDGTATRAGLRAGEATGAEALNAIIGLHVSTLGTNPSGADVSWAQAVLAGFGNTQQTIRSNWANSPDETTALDTVFRAVLGRPADGTDLGYWKSQIAGGTSLAAARVAIAGNGQSRDSIANSYLQILDRPPTNDEVTYWVYVMGLNVDQTAERTNLANYAASTGIIDRLYREVFGRGAGAGDIDWAKGVFIRGGSQDTVRAQMTQSGEFSANVASLYQALLGRAPAPSEAAGFAAGSVARFAPGAAFTLTGTVNGAAQTFATANPGVQLTELAVYVTLNSGVTPGVRDPWGHVTQFNDATQLAAYLLAAAFAEGVVTPVLISTYALTVDWLIQTGQTYLQAGEQELIATRASGGAGTPWGQAHEVLAQAYFDIAAAPAAQRGGASLTQALAYARQAQATLAANANPYAPLYATFYETAARVYLALGTLPAGQAPDALLAAAQRFLAGGLPTNPANTVDATAIANAQADAALQNEALAPALRHAITERLVSTQSSSKTIDVTVDALGRTTVHDKDQSASPVLGIVTAVIDIAAVISGQYWALAVASALNAGQAANDFAHGEALAGVLHVGTAAGLGAGAFAAAGEGVGGTLPFTEAGLQAVAGNATLLGGTVGHTLTVAQEVYAATAFVGGVSGIVNSAQNGNGLGVAAASLETAAAIAGGLVATGSAGDDAKLLGDIAAGLGVAGGVTAGADAIRHGDVANGLVETLGPLAGLIASQQRAIANSASVDTGLVRLADAGNTIPPSVADIIVTRTYQPKPGDIVAGGTNMASAVLNALSRRLASVRLGSPALRLGTTAASIGLRLLADALQRISAFRGHIDGTDIDFVEDRPGRTLILQRTDAGGAPRDGAFVKLQIAEDGTLLGPDGVAVGRFTADGSLVVDKAFNDAWATHQVDNEGDRSTIADTQKLRRNLIKDGGPPPPDHDAHHIAPEAEPGAKDARRILNQYKVDRNSPANGEWVPRPFHQNYLNNNGSYVDYVNGELSNATSAEDVVARLGNIRQAVQNKVGQWNANRADPTKPAPSKFWP